MNWKQITAMLTAIGAGSANMATALTCDFNGTTLTLTPITLIVIVVAMIYVRRTN